MFYIKLKYCKHMVNVKQSHIFRSSLVYVHVVYFNILYRRSVPAIRCEVILGKKIEKVKEFKYF